MTDILRLLVDCASYIWPFRIVHQWERGCYYIFGKHIWTVGAGIYPVIPFFMDVKEISVVYQVIDLPLQSITVQTADSKTEVLTFSANVGISIFDAGLAFNAIDDYRNTVRKSCAGHLAEKLSTMDANRLTVEARGRLLAALRTTLNTEFRPYGIQVDDLRFTDYVPSAPVYRLFNDQTMQGLM